MIPYCESEGIGVIPWSPLARGRLARPWESETKRSETDQFGKKMYSNTEEADRKVVELAGTVSGMTAYPYGETSLQQTIVGLAHDFVGSNNVNCLVPSGNFGSRRLGGQDAADEQRAANGSNG